MNIYAAKTQPPLPKDLLAPPETGAKCQPTRRKTKLSFASLLAVSGVLLFLVALQRPLLERDFALESIAEPMAPVTASQGPALPSTAPQSLDAAFSSAPDQGSAPLLELAQERWSAQGVSLIELAAWSIEFDGPMAQNIPRKHIIRARTLTVSLAALCLLLVVGAVFLLSHKLGEPKRIQNALHLAAGSLIVLVFGIAGMWLWLDPESSSPLVTQGLALGLLGGGALWTSAAISLRGRELIIVPALAALLLAGLGLMATLVVYL